MKKELAWCVCTQRRSYITPWLVLFPGTLPFLILGGLDHSHWSGIT